MSDHSKSRPAPYQSSSPASSSMRQQPPSRRHNGRPTSSKHDIDYLLNSQSGNQSHTPLDGGESTASSSSRVFKGKSNDRPFECHICSFSFAQRSDRNKHVRTVHLRERPFVCEHCSQTFGEKGNLNKHIRALHEKSRPFKCTECDGQFSFQDGLSRHIAMVHREARPFQCPEANCDKTFKQKAHAEKHHSSVHQKLKPCVCFCGAAFRENYNMKQHQRTVHNMNPQ